MSAASDSMRSVGVQAAALRLALGIARGSSKIGGDPCNYSCPQLPNSLCLTHVRPASLAITLAAAVSGRARRPLGVCA